jgi:signal transduction histidine kinase
MHGSAQDVTDARAAEAERADEARRVAAGEARDEALSLLAHDLRSPLSVVVGYVQLLARQAREGTVDADRLVSYGARIEESARQMTTLLEDLLADADPDAGTDQVETAPTDLGDLVRRVCEHHAGVADDARVEAQVPSQPAVLDVSEAKLERALHNLVLNAIKYSPDGAEVTVRLDATPDEARISVADRGIGIPQAEVGRIFERFMRGSNVTGRATGIGLGLSSAKRAVEAHGGTIDVESAEGEGTTFTIRLPRAR